MQPWAGNARPTTEGHKSWTLPRGGGSRGDGGRMKTLASVLFVAAFALPSAAQIPDAEYTYNCDGYIIADYACNPNPDSEVCGPWKEEASGCWYARDYNESLHNVECSEKTTTRDMYCGGAVNHCVGRVLYTAYADGQLPAQPQLQTAGNKNAKWRKCTSYVWRFGHDPFGDWFVAQKRERYETTVYGDACVGTVTTPQE